ncbi:MAG TPA: flagellar basal-body MS-ring/collar protein FliF [Syntrophobacteraceae bacterium]|nr:flagellar basal-body MS-ring/collar protein FliF [Syntrophobacteraceae bacterium]
MKQLLDLFQRIKTGIQAVPTPQRILYGGLFFVLVGSLGFLAYSVNRTEYSPLYSRLSEEDLAAVVSTLKAKKIPYELTGNSVSVPKDSLHETRLTMASEGVPKGSGVGYEIFDQQKLGSTEFVQKINYQRALQGELARTINRMNEVQESRVHLVMPTESVFVADQKPPSAAVVLKLRSGARLEQQQIQGIVNLVASAVQGLNEDKVTVMSTDGQVLFKKNPVDGSFHLTNLQVQLKTNIEEDLRRKVQSLLEQVVGANRVSTRISADLDFNQVRLTEDTYDPDSSVIRSQQRSVESAQGGEAGAKGNPDAPVNMESQLMKSSAPGGQKTSNRQRETVNYEINHVSRQITQAPGNIKKLSVAVIVDGPYEMRPNQEGKPVPTFVGRTPEQIKSIEDLVRKAVGYNESRGDQITVSNIPFATDSSGPDFVPAENRWLRMVKEHQRTLLNIVLIVLAFFFVIRPFMKKFRRFAEEVIRLPEAAPAALPGQKAPLGLVELPPEPDSSTKNQAIALVQRSPQQAATIIRAIMREEM